MLLDKVSQFEDAPGAVIGVHPSPGTLFKCLSRSLDGNVNIQRGSLLNGSQHRLVAGVDHVEGLVLGTVDELPINEELFDESYFVRAHKSIATYLCTYE
jgi:hypothetical protein